MADFTDSVPFEIEGRDSTFGFFAREVQYYEAKQDPMSSSRYNLSVYLKGRETPAILVVNEPTLRRFKSEMGLSG